MLRWLEKMTKGIVNTFFVDEFTCRVCGASVATCPADRWQGLCPECCENDSDYGGHDYEYSADFREHRCIRCDEPAPYDWY